MQQNIFLTFKLHLQWCLERLGSCRKNIWTVLDDVVPLKVTDFCREPPEIYIKKMDGKLVFSVYTFPPDNFYQTHSPQITRGSFHNLLTAISAIKFRVSLYIMQYKNVVWVP